MDRRYLDLSLPVGQSRRMRIVERPGLWMAPDKLATLVGQLAVAPIPERPDRVEAYCKRIVSDFIERDLLREKVALSGAMQRLDAAAEPEKHRTIERELVRIEAERRVLRDE